MKTLRWIAVSLSAVVVLVSIWTVTPTIAQTVRAALVRDTDNPALQPARLYVLASIGVSGYAESNGEAVPAGKRLVVETVSVFGYPPSGGELSALWLTTNDFSTYISLDPTANEKFPGYVAFNRNIRFYFNAGEIPKIQAYGANSTFVNVFLHGYYVNL